MMKEPVRLCAEGEQPLGCINVYKKRVVRGALMLPPHPHLKLSMLRVINDINAGFSIVNFNI